MDKVLYIFAFESRNAFCFFVRVETAKFYKALSMVGTDLSMIQRLLSHRTRDELKRKFRREQKLNQALIDTILCMLAIITCLLDGFFLYSSSSFHLIFVL